jgi:hypothetical protein
MGKSMNAARAALYNFKVSQILSSLDERLLGIKNYIVSSLNEDIFPEYYRVCTYVCVRKCQKCELQASIIQI